MKKSLKLNTANELKVFSISHNYNFALLITLWNQLFVVKIF